MKDHVAIVTGGGGKLGRGICRALSKAGATVIVLELDPARVEGAARAVECDVTDPEACRSAVDDVVEEFGGVDTLLNLAQYFAPDMPLLDLPDTEMLRSFESGPIASMRMMQLCYPHMKARGGGSIVNVASGAGTNGAPRMAAYASAKEAIRGLTRTAALEWGRDNIRVNAIVPFAGHDPAMYPEVIAASPMGRDGDPETDVGSLILFLAGPGTFITGRTLYVDGGIATER